MIMETRAAKRGTPPRRKSQLTPTELEILLTLADGARHGYGLKLEIEERTGGRLKLGSGTLYEAIQRLERAGMIREARGPEATSERDARRRFYRLSTAGMKSLHDELLRLEAIVTYAKTQDLLVAPQGINC